MRSLRILFSHYAIIDHEGFGRSFMIARELVALGHTVTFFTCQTRENLVFPYRKEVRDGVLILSFPDLLPESLLRTGFGFLSIVLKLILVIGKPFDIVHADNGHRPSSGMPCKWHRFLYKSKYVTEWWDFFGRGGQYDDLSNFKKLTKGKYDLFSELRDKRKSDFLIVLSHQMKSRALHAGISADQIEIVNGGCDVSKIEYHPTTKHKINFGLDPSSLVFGFVGMNEGEFFDTVPFVRAIAQLKSSINLQWFTTGRKISSEIKVQYDIGNELIEFGWVDYTQFENILSCADIFILTQEDNLCNRTRWPNKVGDYLSAGRVIITNPVGDIIPLTKSHPESIIACEFSEESLITIITELYHKKAELLTIGKKNRVLAESELSWNQKARQVEIIYNKILGEKNERT